MRVPPFGCADQQAQSESEEEEEDEANKEDGVVDRDYIKMRAAKIGAKFAGQRARAPL